jgi:WD40 repeat protein
LSYYVNAGNRLATGRRRDCRRIRCFPRREEIAMFRLFAQFVGMALFAVSLLATGKVEATQPDKPAPVAVSPDGTRAARGDGKAITIFDPLTSKDLIRMQGHTDLVTALSFSPDGKLLASGSKDSRVNLWDIATGKQILQLKMNQAIVNVLITPDGKAIVVRLADRTTREFNVQTGAEVKNPKEDKKVNQGNAK